MICDPITRQYVEILGKYPVTDKAYRCGSLLTGDFRFVLVRYGEHLAGFSGGFDVGTERDVDVNGLVADDGICEVEAAYRAAPVLASAT